MNMIEQVRGRLDVRALRLAGVMDRMVRKEEERGRHSLENPLLSGVGYLPGWSYAPHPAALTVRS